jgi:methionine-rich copper-binding protein CopC
VNNRTSPDSIMNGVWSNPSATAGSEGSVLMRERSVVLLLLTCLSFAMAGPAWAHAKLVDSNPAGGDVLAKPPEQVRLRFDEPVRFEDTGGAELDPLDPIQVYDEQNTRVDKGDTRASSDDPKVLVVDLKKKLPDGVYGVDWSPPKTATSSMGRSVSPWTVPAQRVNVVPTPKLSTLRGRRWAPPWPHLWRSWPSVSWALRFSWCCASAARAQSALE